MTPRHFLLALVVAILTAAPALAANTTTVGTLTLTPTFDTIGVKATYTNDDNANNSATLQWRVNGSSTWLTAYYPAAGTNTSSWPDRRTTVSGGNSNSANVKQFRGSVFSLTAGTTYEVQVTFSDADGLTGGPSLSTTVTLLSSSTVVLSGAHWYVDCDGSNGSGSSGSPFNTINNGIAAASAGDTIHVNPSAACPAFTVNKSGTAGAWIAIIGDDRDTVLLANTATTIISVAGNYVQIKNLRMNACTNSCLQVQTGQHDVWIDNLYMGDVGTGTASNCVTTYNNSGVEFVGSGWYRAWVFNSTFLGPTSATSCSLSTDQPTAGIYFNGDPSATGQFVVKSSTFNGGFRDCIGGVEAFTTPYNDTDILSNTFLACKDDAIQFEGTDINLRIIGNTSTTAGNACIATETGFVGPIWVIRNVCSLTAAGSNTLFKSGGLQAMFRFHNTAIGTAGAIDGMAGNSTTTYLTDRNNIWKSTGNLLYQIYPTGTSLDYDLFYRPGGGNIVRLWNGASDYTTAAAFFTGQAQEQHGLTGDPLFTDAVGTITSSSPAYNAGVTLANINDANSSCAALSTAPDIGAVEVGGCAPGSSPPVITTAGTLISGTVLSAYATTISGTCTNTPCVWTSDLANSGACTGVTFTSTNSTTATMGGTPTVAGLCSFNVTTTDNTSLTASGPFTITVNAVAVGGSFAGRLLGVVR